MALEKEMLELIKELTMKVYELDSRIPESPAVPEKKEESQAMVPATDEEIKRIIASM